MTELRPKPRGKTRVKHLGVMKASLVAVSMALTVGGWAVLARDDSLSLQQQLNPIPDRPLIQPVIPPPTITAPPPPTVTPAPAQPSRRQSRTGQLPVTGANPAPSQPRPADPQTVPTLPSQPSAPAPTPTPRLSSPSPAPRPQARTRSSR